jgi:signal transduction histidine kinase
LPICHALVTAHGGTMNVTSAPGQGATFVVELPVAHDSRPDLVVPPGTPTTIGA